MLLRLRALLTFLLFASPGCEPDERGKLGYTAQILVESDGNYRDDFCVFGTVGISSGKSRITYMPGSTEGFDLSYGGEDELWVRGEDLREGATVELFHETFDAGFGAMPQVRKLEYVIEGHQIVLYVESLAAFDNCDTAVHSRANYGPYGSQDMDGGTDIYPGEAGVALSVPSLLDVHGTGPDDVWAVGFDGVVLHYDGQRWTQTVDDASETLLYVWASAPGGDVWIVARRYEGQHESRRVLRGRPGAWVEVDVGAIEGELVHRPWGTSPEDVWVTGYVEDENGRSGMVHHLVSGAWTMPAAYVGGRLSGVFGSGPQDMFIGGSDGTGYGGYFAHFEGGEWKSHEYPESWIGAVWGTGPNDLWTAGGELTHFDGTTWTESETPLVYQAFHGIWGSGPNDVWAVGQQGSAPTGVSGIILHWGGSAWTEDSVRPRNELRGLWGSGPDDVWAVGSGALYHFDGHAWSLTRADEITVSR